MEDASSDFSSERAADPAARSAPTSSRAAGAAPLLAVVDVSKAFGATQALASCSFELRAGEIHGLVGENGSGKSTLVKILSGVHQPDAGTVVMKGEPVTLATPRTAQARGIVTVYQEILVVGARSVLDNVWLGSDGVLRNGFPDAYRREQAEAILRALLGKAPDLDAPAGLLTLSERQSCAIARALLRRFDVLILDEATSALDVATRDRLFALARERAAAGAGVIFITHRMDEIAAITDRVTVLRSGLPVGTKATSEVSVLELTRMMTGAERLAGDAPLGRRGKASEGEPVLRARGLRLRPGAAEIDLAVRSGEIVGLAGLEGQGQDEFLRALAGASRAEGQVLRLQEGVETELRSPSHAAELGIAYIPRDRRGEGIFETLSIRENFGVPTAGNDRRYGLLWPSRTQRRFSRYVESLGIRLRDSRDAITTLSGGNQQKVVLARWLEASPAVLLLNDPTRGVDIGAKRDIYRLLIERANEGLAVVMLSTELDEHVELMDRVVVFREHEVFAELARAQLSREALVSAYFGGRT